MNKKRIAALVILMFFLGGLGGIFFNRFLIPTLSTVSGFRWLAGLRSDSPIVITHREEIRLNEGANFIELTKQAQGITVSVFHAREPKLLGNGVVLTTDGLIFTVKEALGNQTEFRVVLNDGRSYPAEITKTFTIMILQFFLLNLFLVYHKNTLHLISLLQLKSFR